MATLMEETLLVESGYHTCNASVGEKDTIANLMSLDMTNFDVILVMD